MPAISQFFGIVIRMFWRQHAPPHFHALYERMRRQSTFGRAKSFVTTCPDAH